MARPVELGIPGDYQLRALQSGWFLQRAWHRARLDLIEHVMPPARQGLILDAAAGSGILTWRFPAARIVSADLRQSACAVVRAHTPSAMAAAALVDALPFVGGTFRQVYFLEAIEHLTEDEGRRALAELHRVATPGAACLITTPNYASHWPALEHLLELSGSTPAMRDAQHVSRYEPRRLAATAAASGWRVRRMGSFNLLAPVIGAVSARAGSWTVRKEADGGGTRGALLFAVCERPA